MIVNLTQPFACKKEGGRDNDDEKCGNDRKRSNVDSGMSIIHSSNAMYRLNPSFLQQSATMVFLKLYLLCCTWVRRGKVMISTSWRGVPIAYLHDAQ